jgi:hypothetical protein
MLFYIVHAASVIEGRHEKRDEPAREGSGSSTLSITPIASVHGEVSLPIEDKGRGGAHTKRTVSLAAVGTPAPPQQTDFPPRGESAKDDSSSVFSPKRLPAVPATIILAGPGGAVHENARSSSSSSKKPPSSERASDHSKISEAESLRAGAVQGAAVVVQSMSGGSSRSDRINQSLEGLDDREKTHTSSSHGTSTAATAGGTEARSSSLSTGSSNKIGNSKRRMGFFSCMRSGSSSVHD